MKLFRVLALLCIIMAYLPLFGNCDLAYHINEDDKLVAIQIISDGPNKCTADSFNQFYQNTPDKYKGIIKEVIQKIISSDGRITNYKSITYYGYDRQDLIIKDLRPKKTNVISLGSQTADLPRPNNNHRDKAEDEKHFENNFNVKFNAEALRCKGVREISFNDFRYSPSILSNNQFQRNLASAGVPMLTILDKGLIKDYKNDIKQSWDVMMHGYVQHDPREPLTRLKILQKILKNLNETIDSLAQSRIKLSHENELLEIHVKNLIHINDDKQAITQNKMNEISTLIGESEKKYQAFIDNSDHFTVSLKKRSEDIENEISHLSDWRKDLFDEDGLKKLKDDLSNDIYDTNTVEGLKKIEALRKSLEQNTFYSNNPEKQEQYKLILSTLYSEQGILIPLQMQYEAIAGTSVRFDNLLTDMNTNAGKAIREGINKALAYAVQDIGSENSLAAVEQMQKADHFLGSGEREIGNRYYARAHAIMDYALDPQKRLQYQKYSQTDLSQNVFDNKFNSSTYQGYEVTLVSNALATYLKDAQIPDLWFHAQLAVQQADFEAKKNLDGFSYSMFHYTLDRAWSMVDHAKGFAQGIAFGVYDTTTGLVQLVRHPIQSTEALYLAIKNYDKTFNIVTHHFKELFNDYVDGTPERRGEIEGRLVIDVVSSYVSISKLGKVAKVAQFNKIAKGIEFYENLRKASSKLVIKQLKNRMGFLNSLTNSTVKTGAEHLNSLNKVSQSEARTLLEKAGFKSKGNRTSGGWETFKHADGSRIDIGPGGRVVRTQAPKYGTSGQRINKGQRVDSLGKEIDRNIPHDQHPLETLLDW